MGKVKLTEAAETILKERYYLKDSKGNIVEDWEKLCRRVAKAISSKEGVKYGMEKRYFESLYNRDLVASSPILMNAGTKLGQLSACISGDSYVYTKRGLVYMKDVVIGDKVLTHRGRFKKVTKHWSNGIKSVFGLSSFKKNSRYYNLKATGDHKVFSKNRKWCRVDQLKDFKVPNYNSNNYYIKEFNMFDYAKYVSNKNPIEIDGRIRFLNLNIRQKSGKYDDRVTSVKSKIINNKDLMWLFGVYLANGNIDRDRTLRITFNKKDMNLINKCKRVIDDNFGVNSKIQEYSGRNWVDVNIGSRLICALISKNFKQKTQFKMIPEWVFNTQKEYREALFEGIKIDSHINIHTGSITFVLANPTLAYQILLLGRGLGKNGNFKSDARNKLSKLPTSRVFFSKGIQKKFNELNRSDGIIDNVEVFDMEIEEDHSFVAGDFIVHNCFVLPVEDSIEGIFDAVKYAAVIHKSGGGTGMSFSNLRSKNSMVGSTQGVASGAVSFIRPFNEATEVIKQGSKRRGANMGMLNVTHPEIKNFIKAKDDITQLLNFNLSVGYTDNFMDKVLSRDPEAKYNLIDPHSKEEFEQDVKEIFDLAVERSWATGEPGVAFIDRANANNPVPHLGLYFCTNPCNIGTSSILTDKGLRQLKDIKIGDVIWSKDGWTQVRNVWNRGIKKTYKYVTNAGIIYSTDNHRIIQKGQKIEICKAHSIDTITGSFDREIKHNIQDVVDGLVLGDGTVKDKKYKLLCIGEDDVDYFKSEIAPYIGEHFDKGYEYHINTNLTIEEINRTFERVVPARYMYSNFNVISGFLRGIFSANGHVIQNKGYRVCLTQSSRVLIEQVQIMLSAIGIRSYISTYKEHDTEFKNGIFKCKESYKLNTADIREFHKYIGFIQKYKNDRLENILHKSKGSKKITFEIKEKGFYSEEEVFDIEVDNKSHTFWCNGLNVSNCGELWLLFYESCNLGAVNLARMVKEGKIDWEKLKYIIRLGTRFLDSVIDNNKFPLPEIKEMTEKIRRIGLGITGLHDLLIQLEIPYGTQKARDVASEIQSFVEKESVKMSEEVGEEKGVFPAYDEKYCKFPPRRNAQTTTIQPSGTMSMLMNCASGCEPYFYLAYYKHVLDDVRLLMVNKYFESVAKREGFYSKELMGGIALSGTVEGNEKVPHKWREIFRCAQDIKWQDHVKMQAALQNNGVHGSISKTINMNKDATQEDVRDAIILAYKLGCKGITVYRDGCRKGQPVQLTKEGQSGSVFVKRVLPDELPAKRYRIKCGDEKNRYVIISFDEDEQPIEIFASDKRNSDLESASNQALIFRLMSTAFRYGIPIEEIIKQLERSTNNMFDLPNQLANIMKRFASKTEKGYKVKCPECGQDSFIFQEGCSKCLSCGYSKCG